MKKSKMFFGLLLAAVILSSCVSGSSVEGDTNTTQAGENSEVAETNGTATEKNTDETQIIMSDTGITVNGTAISENQNQAIYVSKKIETHSEVADGLENVENTVITITQSGTYRFSGVINDAQIAVKASDNDSVNIILDGVDITCRTAPALLIYSAYEPAEPGEAGVTLTLAQDSENTITGSHTAATEEDSVKHDGAISSNVSLIIDGTGSMTVNGDTEGIEVKYKHLTINGSTPIIVMD